MFCFSMSMNFIASQIFGFLPALFLKITVVFPSFRSNVLSTIACVDKFNCNTLMAGPKFFYDILASPQLKTHNFTSTRNILVGSQTCSTQLLQQTLEKLPHLRLVINCYGMTETLISSAYHIIPSDELRVNDSCLSIGRPLPYFEMKCVDPDKNCVVPHDTFGEIYVRSFAHLNGYWAEPNKTLEIIDSDGW